MKVGSFLPSGPWDPTQVAGFGNWHPYLLSHLTGLIFPLRELSQKLSAPVYFRLIM